VKVASEPFRMAEVADHCFQFHLLRLPPFPRVLLNYSKWPNWSFGARARFPDIAPTKFDGRFYGGSKIYIFKGQSIRRHD